MSGYGDIWQKLSAVDVSRHVEKKGNLSYLSWAWAWGTLMEHYPEAEFEMGSTQSEPDGSVTVWCVVRIGDCARDMWLPVMDHRNNAIEKPDAREISDARMRCLVKCLALFGLGFSLYAGEDLPQKREPKKAAPRNSALSDANREKLNFAAKTRSAEIAEDTGDETFTAKVITQECMMSLGIKHGEVSDENFPALFSAIQEYGPGEVAA